ncbi:MAG TPA: 1-deoxy-D-xylulose-5-phosphate synthase N-terminal domain-containing protein [Methylomirabilota bacterium]|nr:1-deoxy-D-xylulose-5-phosphate synthase N-terminal domain-containing protein [Methylomirabilota bacterium]
MTVGPPDLALFESIQRRVLWLSTWMVHHANNLRPNPDGTKIGGHQASSSSVVSLMTALYFGALKPGDVVATKAHGSPVFYAIQYLRGRLPAERLKTLREFGGLQAYPSRRGNPEIVDLSTGSMGLGSAATIFGALTTRYLTDHFGVSTPERFIAVVGDAELDEGNVWEALLEEPVARLGNLLWIVDVNRQSLDRVVPEGRVRAVREWFRAAGWNVIELRWGRRLEAVFAKRAGDRLRRRLDAMPNAAYQALLRLPAAAARKALMTGPDGEVDSTLDRLLAGVADAELQGLLGDVGGHDLELIMEAYHRANEERDRPTVILAQTIKGWGLPLAGDPMNHGALLTTAQIEELRASLGITPGEEWAGFPPESPEARLIGGLAPLYSPPEPRPTPPLPEALEETYPPQCSTQEALGRMLQALARLPAGERVVTVSADVAVTTHLVGWINRKGVYALGAKPNYFADLPQVVQWREGPEGQHIELGIAEHNLFLLLEALGLAHELSGVTLFPIGALYDPFVTRGLDALYHALYAGARFIVAATPSGVSLSPEGGAHQSVITPPVGIALPDMAYFDPPFAREVEWILLDTLAKIAGREGESVYLRLSTKPVDQSLAPPPSADYRARVLRGGYRLVDRSVEPGCDPEDNAVHIFAAGVMVPEAVEASRALRAEGLFANVFAVTSPDLLYRGLREPRPYLLDLVTAAEEGVPVVSVLDGHSQTLAFVGAALGVPQIPLGVDHFGQSGARQDLYRHYGIDAPAIAQAARTLLGR